MSIMFEVTVQTLAFLLNSLNKVLNFCASAISPGELFSLKLVGVIFMRHHV